MLFLNIRVVCIVMTINYLIVSNATYAIAQTVVSSFEVGNSPRGIAVNTETNLIYVTNMADNSVSVIDGSTNQIINNIPVGKGPLGIGIDSFTNQVYVGDGNGITVIDANINEVVTTIELTEAEGTGSSLPPCPSPEPSLEITSTPTPIPGSPPIPNSPSLLCGSDLGTRANIVKVNSVSNLVYVTKAVTGNVCCATNIWVIDAKTNRVIDNIKLSATNTTPNLPLTIFSNVRSLGINQLSNSIYAVFGGEINVLDGDTNLIIKTVPYTGEYISINSTQNLIYVSNCTVNVIDDITNGIIATVGEKDEAPGTIEINPTTNHIFVINRGSDRISVIDSLTNNIITKIDGLHQPQEIAVNPGTGLVYVLSVDHNSPELEKVTVIKDLVLPTSGTLSTPRADFLIKRNPEGELSSCPINTCEKSLSVQFIDISSGNPTNWLWEFGDNTTSSEQNPTHIYEKGIFNVKLTVENASDINTKEKSEFISVFDCPPTPSPERPGAIPTPTPNSSNITPDLTPTPNPSPDKPASTPTPSSSPGQPDLTPTPTPLNKMFTIDCNNTFNEGPSGFKSLIIKSGEEESCVFRLTDSNQNTPVSVSTIQRIGDEPSINISPANGITDVNGELRFTISPIKKGINWVAWAIPNKEGKLEFTKRAYTEGLAWGMFIKVKK